MHTTYFTYRFTPCSESEAIGRTIDTREERTYWHNVAGYRETPRWCKVSQSQFHLLMATGMTLAA